jgi:ABC-type bacteriocin/lantibiotic exporter with double-glycine peptidase domain
MYDPVSGVIRINGLDIKDFNLAELRKKVGYVSQEPVLMPLTIEQNITFGESEIDEARLERAMALSNSNEFVSKLDRGLNTLLQEDGRGLSGGQKQRIALARALYREPSILILDEPTSALDKSSEKSFVKAIQNLKGRMIIIMCTHKPEAFSFADRFIEIRDGVATESTKG